MSICCRQRHAKRSAPCMPTRHPPARCSNKRAFATRVTSTFSTRDRRSNAFATRSTRSAARERCPSRSAKKTRCPRSEEHTSELQSLTYLVCRLLLEKKKKTHTHTDKEAA